MTHVLARVEVRRRRFTVEEYYRMADVGILRPEDRVELIEGEIVEMSPIGLRHAFCVLALSTLFRRVLAEDRALIPSQNPVRLPRDTEPQPDLVLIRPPLSQYAVRHPEPQDVLLLVEVAETSYRFDRDVKLPLYAAAGIPEVWIVDLTREVVEVFRDPEPRAYRTMQSIGRGGHAAPAAFPDAVVSVADILPPPT